MRLVGCSTLPQAFIFSLGNHSSQDLPFSVLIFLIQFVQEATRAVAEVAKKKREHNGATCTSSGLKIRHSPGKSIHRTVLEHVDPYNEQCFLSWIAYSAPWMYGVTYDLLLDY